MVLVIWFQVILTPFHVFDGHPAAVLRYLQKEQARRGRIHAAVYATGDCVYGGEQEFKRSGRDSGDLRSLVTTYII